MNLFDKARELGQMIMETDEFKKLKECENRFESDEKSIELMKDYQGIQNELLQALQTGKDDETINEIRDRFMAKQDEINNYEVTTEFLKARTEFENMMKQVNDIIATVVRGIDGDSNCSSSGCAGCSGC